MRLDQMNVKEIWRRLREHPLARIGPGLITGVADDDPSGIATYSQAGAQYGLGMLWTMPLSYPLMAAVQSMCARIGRVTGKGLAANMAAAFPKPVVWSAVLLLLVANTLNIAADIAAMGETAELVLGGNRHLLTALFAMATLLAQVYVPYHRYVLVLRWLTLSLLAYAAVLFTVHVPWHTVALRTFWPGFVPDRTAATVIVAILGTTISPYLFFWQASEEVEDMHARARAEPLLRNARPAVRELRRIRWDTWSGMFYSNVSAYFIILATALTLHAAGITRIDTAAQAAGALRPLAGNFAFTLFALGILGVGLIGVPVLAGSGAYALAEIMHWKTGLERRALDARGFYGVIAVSMLCALAIQYLPVSPMRALFWSAVINGVVSVPLIVMLVILASRRSVLGAFRSSRATLALGWAAAVTMGAAAVRMFMG
jgi:NRAMP (natural resistance-associated macrophage protein)-like metal ion transporter